jgi:hypothetical protein
MRVHLLITSVATALLAACGQQAGDGSAPSSANMQSAETAEAAPATAGRDAFVYPGAKGGGDSFSTSDPIDRVVAYYWADGPVQQRAGQTWAVSKPEKRDAGYLVNITTIGGGQGQSFVVYLNPGVGGGTDGHVRLLTEEEIKSGVKL